MQPGSASIAITDGKDNKTESDDIFDPSIAAPKKKPRMMKPGDALQAAEGDGDSS